MANAPVVSFRNPNRVCKARADAVASRLLNAFAIMLQFSKKAGARSIIAREFGSVPDAKVKYGGMVFDAGRFPRYNMPV
jgi:hypothetical protein